MRTATSPSEAIKGLLKRKDRSYAWLSRESGIEYKRLLREAKHGTSELSLVNGAVIAEVLGVDLPVLLSGKDA